MTEDANQAKEAVDSAQTSVDQAQTNFDTAQKNLADANTNKTTADSQVEAKKSEVSTAKDAVDTAQKALDTKGSKAELDQAQTDFDSAKSAQANAQKDLTEKQTAKENADKAVVPAKEDLATAKDTQSLLQEAVDHAKSKQQAQANVVTDLQNKLNQANQTATKTNVQIHVTNELKQAVQKYVNDVYANADKTTLNNDAKAIQDALTNPKKYGFPHTDITGSGSNSKIETKNNGGPLSINYIPSPEDEELMEQHNNHPLYASSKQLVGNLTNKQLLELEQFTADIINAMRDALGISDKVGHVIVNQDAINIANQLGKNEVATTNANITKDVANKYGLDYSKLRNELLIDRYGFFFNFVAQSLPWKMSYVKGMLAYNLNEYISLGILLPNGQTVTDRNGNPLYDHDLVGLESKSLLGITPNLIKQAKNNTNKDQYFGWSHPDFPNRKNDINVSTRFIFIPQSMITDKSKFDQTPLFQNTTNDTTALRSEFDQATSRLQSLTNTLTQAQVKLDTANAQVKTAQTAYDQALKQQTNADQALSTAKTALQTADQNLATAQTKLDSAKQAYADSLKDTATKQEALKQAQTTLAQKQAELDNLVALQTKANSHLADANINYLNAERQLKDAQNQLAVAKDAFNKATSTQKEAQKQADQDPAELQEALVTAQQNLVTAQTNLAQAQAQKDEAQKIFDTESAKLQELQTKLTEAKQALETAKTNATKANNHYESLLNADKNLAQAQTAYDQAVLAYNKVQADLATAQAKLASAKQTQQQAQAELAKAKQEQMTLMNFEKAYQAAQSENPARKLNVHTVGNEKQQPAKKNNVLPQMGDKNSLAGVVLGMMTTLTALGTAIVSRRKRS